MAGVGFELRRMIDQRDGFVNKVRAYACAGLISSGPWLMTILTLTLLNLAGPYLGGTAGYSLFRALVTYAFAFSLILQGIVQMAVTRRIADLLYSHRYDRVLPAFAAMLLIVGLVHTAIGVVFCVRAEFQATVSCLAVSLFAVVGMTWMALIWLSVVRQYDQVLRAYIHGTVISMLGIVLLVLGQGTTGVLAAYTAGQSFILVMLIRTITRGMETGGDRDFTVYRSMLRFPVLIGVGLFYNAAIWVDKMIFWFADGIGPHPMVRYHPLYDTCSFLAYLTVVPALAVNLVRLETSFYEKYRGYYGAILGGTPLGVIEDRRERMFENLRESVVRLLRIQGFITAAVILFAPFIIDLLKLPPVSIRLFRLTCLGAFFHVLLLITILLQMYFDLQRQALATSFVFLVLNAGLAWWSLGRGIETYGVGYALSAFLSLLLGYLLLHRSLDRLDYLTFTNQPVGDDDQKAAKVVLEEEEQSGADDEESDGEEPVPGRPPEEVPEETEEVEPEEEPPQRVEIFPEMPAVPEPEPDAVPEPEPEPAPEAVPAAASAAEPEPLGAVADEPEEPEELEPDLPVITRTELGPAIDAPTEEVVVASGPEEEGEGPDIPVVTRTELGPAVDAPTEEVVVASGPEEEGEGPDIPVVTRTELGPAVEAPEKVILYPEPQNEEEPATETKAASVRELAPEPWEEEEPVTKTEAPSPEAAVAPPETDDDPSTATDLGEMKLIVYPPSGEEGAKLVVQPCAPDADDVPTDTALNLTIGPEPDEPQTETLVDDDLAEEAPKPRRRGRKKRAE